MYRNALQREIYLVKCSRSTEIPRNVWRYLLFWTQDISRMDSETQWTVNNVSEASNKRNAQF